MPKVVIHFDERGNWRAYAEGDVEVYCVDDAASEDRVFRMAPAEIPQGLLDGAAGHSGDRSPAETRAHRAKAMMEGRPHLSEVK